MDKKALIEEAWRKAKYAHNSYSKELIYEAHGFIKGIVDSGVVTFHEVADIDSFIVRDTINNPEWFHEVERQEKEMYLKYSDISAMSEAKARLSEGQ